MWQPDTDSVPGPCGGGGAGRWAAGASSRSGSAWGSCWTWTASAWATPLSLGRGTAESGGSEPSSDDDVARGGDGRRRRSSSCCPEPGSIRKIPTTMTRTQATAARTGHRRGIRPLGLGFGLGLGRRARRACAIVARRSASSGADAVMRTRDAQRLGDRGRRHGVQQPRGGDLAVAARAADRAVRDVPGELARRCRRPAARRAGRPARPRSGSRRGPVAATTTAANASSRSCRACATRTDASCGVTPRTSASSCGSSSWRRERSSASRCAPLSTSRAAWTSWRVASSASRPGRLGRALALGRQLGVRAAAQALGAGHGVQPAAEQPRVGQSADALLHGDQGVVQRERGASPGRGAGHGSSRTAAVRTRRRSRAGRSRHPRSSDCASRWSSALSILGQPATWSSCCTDGWHEGANAPPELGFTGSCHQTPHPLGGFGGKYALYRYVRDGF